MAASITHKFFNPKADSTDTTIVRPSDWNDEHDVDLSSLDYIGFNTSPTGVPTTEGTLSWNPTDHTLNLQSELAGSVLQVGQEFWVRALNKTGSTITDGAAVYINDAQGNRPTIALADASSVSTALTIGVATADIPHNDEGYVTVLGLVRGYNTSSFTDGDILYLSTTPGELTNSKPANPAYTVRVATALNSTTSGSIFVNPDPVLTAADVKAQSNITHTITSDTDDYPITAPYVLGTNNEDVLYLNSTNFAIYVRLPFVGYNKPFAIEMTGDSNTCYYAIVTGKQIGRAHV